MTEAMKSREQIKFRVWDEREKVYRKDILINTSNNNFFGDLTGVFIPEKDQLNNGYGIEYARILRWTGLFDLNEKEIYEGDICIMHMPNTWGDDGKLSKKVQNRTIFFEWKNHGWNLNGFNHLYGTYYWGGIKGKMLEVIGNIYENPELLK